MATESTNTSSQSARLFPDELLTGAQVAAIFQVTPRTVWRWGAAGRIPRVQIHGITRYRMTDVTALLNDDDPGGIRAVEKGANHGGACYLQS
jgi:hypothetical protein